MSAMPHSPAVVGGEVLTEQSLESLFLQLECISALRASVEGRDGVGLADASAAVRATLSDCLASSGSSTAPAPRSVWVVLIAALDNFVTGARGAEGDVAPAAGAGSVRPECDPPSPAQRLHLRPGGSDALAVLPDALPGQAVRLTWLLPADTTEAASRHALRISRALRAAGAGMCGARSLAMASAHAWPLLLQHALPPAAIAASAGAQAAVPAVRSSVTLHAGSAAAVAWWLPPSALPAVATLHMSPSAAVEAERNCSDSDSDGVCDRGKGPGTCGSRWEVVGALPLAETRITWLRPGAPEAVLTVAAGASDVLRAASERSLALLLQRGTAPHLRCALLAPLSAGMAAWRTVEDAAAARAAVAACQLCPPSPPRAPVDPAAAAAAASPLAFLSPLPLSPELATLRQRWAAVLAVAASPAERSPVPTSKLVPRSPAAADAAETGASGDPTSCGEAARACVLQLLRQGYSAAACPGGPSAECFARSTIAAALSAMLRAMGVDTSALPASEVRDVTDVKQLPPAAGPQAARACAALAQLLLRRLAVSVQAMRSRYSGGSALSRVSMREAVRQRLSRRRGTRGPARTEAAATTAVSAVAAGVAAAAERPTSSAEPRPSGRAAMPAQYARELALQALLWLQAKRLQELARELCPLDALPLAPPAALCGKCTDCTACASAEVLPPAPASPAERSPLPRSPVAASLAAAPAHGDAVAAVHALLQALCLALDATDAGAFRAFMIGCVARLFAESLPGLVGALFELFELPPPPGVPVAAVAAAAASDALSAAAAGAPAALGAPSAGLRTPASAAASRHAPASADPPLEAGSGRASQHKRRRLASLSVTDGAAAQRRVGGVSAMPAAAPAKSGGKQCRQLRNDPLASVGMRSAPIGQLSARLANAQVGLFSPRPPCVCP